MAILQQPRIIGLTLAESWRRLKRRLRIGSLGSVKLSGPAPDRLLLAPQDLRTADPTLANEFYAGIFAFAGKTVETHGKSPFQFTPPSVEWERELNGFRWLRHLGISDTALAHSNAQAFIKDWIGANTRTNASVVWDVEVASRRLISWLCHSLVFAEAADHSFYRLLMKSVGQHIRYLRRMALDAPDGMPRLSCRIALAYAAICISDQKMSLRNAHKHLETELANQIYPDGGHITRNPSVLPDLLADLLPLRQAAAKQGQAPSPELVSAIDRIIPAIRLLRHRDGNLARFNGTSYTKQDLVATLLRYDDTRGSTPNNASHSGYQRLEGGTTVVIIDTGNPPKGELSTNAHAGCLSFEMSCGNKCIITNCGAPNLARAGDNQAWRSTAAHSTACLNDTSSSKFQITGSSSNYLEGHVISGPSKVKADRRINADGEQVTAFHDAYMREFGIRHRRMIGMTSSGEVVMGSDQFTDTGGNPTKYATRDSVAIRFHLHPNVQLADGELNSVILVSDGGGTWKFSCVDASVAIEESIFFSTPGGAVRTRQIVLAANASKTTEIRWIFERQS